MSITKIISGGQTGADQGGLEAGRILGLETGGTAPYNLMTDSGVNEKLVSVYGLVPGPFDPKTYPKRTKLNVKDSDGTVWFGKCNSPGYYCTLSAIKQLHKPHIENPTVAKLNAFILKYNISVLNVAGNRESRNPGIFMSTVTVLVNALS